MGCVRVESSVACPPPVSPYVLCWVWLVNALMYFVWFLVYSVAYTPQTVPEWLIALNAVHAIPVLLLSLIIFFRNTQQGVLGRLIREVNIWILFVLTIFFVWAYLKQPEHLFLSRLAALVLWSAIAHFICLDAAVICSNATRVGTGVLAIVVCIRGVLYSTVVKDTSSFQENLITQGEIDVSRRDVIRTVFLNVLFIACEATINCFRDPTRTRYLFVWMSRPRGQVLQTELITSNPRPSQLTPSPVMSGASVNVRKAIRPIMFHAPEPTSAAPVLEMLWGIWPLHSLKYSRFVRKANGLHNNERGVKALTLFFNPSTTSSFQNI